MNTNGQLNGTLNGNHRLIELEPKESWPLWWVGEAIFSKIFAGFALWGFYTSIVFLLSFINGFQRQPDTWDLNHLTTNQIDELLAPYQPEQTEDDLDDYDPYN